MDLAYIDARPHKHVVRHADYHVLHPIIIEVSGQTDVRSPQRLCSIGKANVHLLGTLCFQVLVAVVEEIVLVEGRCTEDVFVGSPQAQLGCQRIAHAQRRREATHIVGPLAILGVVQVKGVQQARHSRQPSLGILGRKRLQNGVSVRTRVGRQRRVEVVVGIVCRIVESPLTVGGIEQTYGTISFALVVVGILRPSSHHAVVIE